MAEQDREVPRIGADAPSAEGLPTVERLARMVGDFGSSLQLEEILQNLATSVREHVDHDTFAVLLLDELGQELRFHFAVGYSDEVVLNWRFGLGQGIVGNAALRQETILVDEVARDPRYISATDVVSELAIPLVAKGRTIGVLDVGSKQAAHFTQAHVQLLTFLAGHLANAIENSRLYENVRDQARTLSLLHEISRELTSILDREKLLRTVAELIKRLIDFQVFSVLLWDEESQELQHAFTQRYDERFVQKGGFRLGQGVTGTVAALRQPMRVPNVHLNPHYASCGHGVEVRSELAVPLVFKDRLVGVLDVESVEYNAFTEQHEQMLATLGSYIAVALENALLYEKVIADESRLERDLETAREIQKGLLQIEVPETPGAEIGFAYRPARQLGGDFYDALPYGGSRVALAAGDVAGKGTAAALFGMLAIGMLRSHVVEHPSQPAEMLAELNRHLQQPGISNRYVAMAFGVYDPATRSLSLANAGFTRPLLVRNGEVHEIPVTGVPLGMLPGTTYDQKTLTLQPGDLVVLASDGVTESVDRRCEEFSVRRLRSLLVEYAPRSAQEIADSLLQSSEAFAVVANHEDDRTVVVLKVV